MTEREDDPQKAPPERAMLGSRRRIVKSVRRGIFLVIVLGSGLAAGLAVLHPDTPLPPAWNPAEPLSVLHPVTPLTDWKLRRAISDPSLCVATLQENATVRAMPPLEDSPVCYIRNRVRLSAVGQTEIESVETACATALRLAMWERHGVQPAARAILGTDVSALRQIGSYNCRAIRTSQGTGTRLSTHATAEAIDISGFDLADGRRIRLIRDWQSTGPEAAFLRRVRDSACRWFATTLGPDYNSLHADHFHLQSRGWGTCR